MQNDILHLQDQIKELSKELKDQGKVLTQLCTKIEGIEELYSQKMEMLLMKITTRMDLIEERQIRLDKKFEDRQSEMGKRIGGLTEKLNEVEKRPAEDAKKKADAMSHTLRTSVITGLVSLMLGVLIATLAGYIGG